MSFKFKHSVYLFFLCILYLHSAAYGAENKETAIVSYATNRPLIYPENQQIKGLYSDVLRVVFEQHLGVKLQFQNRPWKRAQTDVKMGRSDIIVTVPTEERLRYVVASSMPIYQLKRRLYTYPNHPQLPEIMTIENIDDVVKARLKMAAVIGDGWFKEKLLSRGVDANLVPDPRHSFRLLADGRVDLVITSPSVYKNATRLNRNASRILDTHVDLESLAAHILIGKRSRYVARMPEINRILENMYESGQLQAIYNRYN